MLTADPNAAPPLSIRQLQRHTLNHKKSEIRSTFAKLVFAKTLPNGSNANIPIASIPGGLGLVIWAVKQAQEAHVWAGPQSHAPESRKSRELLNLTRRY